MKMPRFSGNSHQRRVKRRAWLRLHPPVQVRFSIEGHELFAKALRDCQRAMAGVGPLFKKTLPRKRLVSSPQVALKIIAKGK